MVSGPLEESFFRSLLSSSFHHLFISRDHYKKLLERVATLSQSIAIGSVSVVAERLHGRICPTTHHAQERTSMAANFQDMMHEDPELLQFISC